MNSYKNIILMVSVLTNAALIAQSNDPDDTFRRVGIGCTLNTTSIQRGGGGFAVDYIYAVKPEWWIGISTHYGFFAHENIDRTYSQSNSISIAPSIKYFFFDDLYVEANAGMYQEENDLLRSHSRVLHNYAFNALGCGYTIPYTTEIMAAIGVKVLYIRDEDMIAIVERQFAVTVNIFFNPKK